MKKVLTLLCIFSALSFNSFAQKPTAPKSTPPPGPPRPMPYVLKKEYDPAMADISSRVNSALNAAASARRGISDGFSKVVELDSQMQQVQDILNSANFKIAITSDSLKTTRTSIEEFRTVSENNIKDLQAKNDLLKKYLYILFGASIFLLLLVAIITNVRVSKVTGTVTKMEVSLKRSLIEEMERNHAQMQKEVKDEIQSLKGRIQIETGSLRTELKSQMNRDKDAMMADLNMLKDKMGMGDAPPENAGEKS